MIPRDLLAFIDLWYRCEPAYATFIAVGPGWWPIVIDLHRKLWIIDPDYRVHQVKEKFGGLRYYCSIDATEPADSLIRMAEGRAEVTCETCGSGGSLRKGGWLRTLCDDCEARRSR